MAKNQRAFEQRRQAKLNRQKANAKDRAKSRRTKVQRAEDIAFVEGQIKTLAAQRQALADGFSTYHAKIQAQVEKVLRDAGVWDVIQALEAGREKRRMEDQEKADQLGKQIADLEKVYAFLKARETSLLTPAASEPPPPEIVNGIDVSKLDHETRILVESGNQETIEHLQGRKQSQKERAPAVR